MSIPDLTALGFTAIEDSKYFKEEVGDPTIRKEIEGGWIVTRARFTRPPATVYTTGWTDISDADKKFLMGTPGTNGGFYNGLRGGAASFTYIHPVSGESLTVRFKEPPKPVYTGMGGNDRWDIANVLLEQV